MSVSRLARLALLAGLGLCVQTDARRDARDLYARGDCLDALEACRTRLAQAPDDASALALAGQILRDPRHVASATSERVMAVLAQHPTLTKARVVPAGEPGQPLVLCGTVRAADGAPLAGARLHVFQTDKDGHYTPAKVMDEPHARLFAHVMTAADGRFELETIRPGAYPGTPERQGLEWRIPSHVHFEVEHAGFAPRRFQAVFDDDPRMQPEYWREWAMKGKHPIVTLARDEQGVQRGELEIALEEP